MRAPLDIPFVYHQQLILNISLSALNPQPEMGDASGRPEDQKCGKNLIVNRALSCLYML
jgi:hypothetical protein